MIMLLHEVLSVFFVLCFCFIGGVVEFIARGCLSFVTRGCLSCYSGCFCFLFGVFFGWGVGGGHAKTFLFRKLHAQFAVLQIARTRA